jgi:NAD(P)-dependent dehydrogenase (short-subunit alcohol dehydrogenase family)
MPFFAGVSNRIAFVASPRNSAPAGSTGQIPHLVTERFDEFSVQKSEPGAPYEPSKAALESATVIWAKDLVGTGVTVNALAPGGPANTRMIPKSELATDPL